MLTKVMIDQKDLQDVQDVLKAKRELRAAKEKEAIRREYKAALKVGRKYQRTGNPLVFSK